MHLFRIEFSKSLIRFEYFLWQNPKLCIFNLEVGGGGLRRRCTIIGNISSASCHRMPAAAAAAVPIPNLAFQMRKHLLHLPSYTGRSGGWLVALSDFHCLESLRPRDVIYSLKAMTNTSFQITILPSVFFPKCGFPRCIFSIAYVSNHNLSPH